MKLIQMLKGRLSEERIAKIVRPHTLVGPERLHNLYVLSQRIEEEQVPGDVIECGVCNGGRLRCWRRRRPGVSGKTVWLLDSFQGMPKPGNDDGDGPGGDAAEDHIGKELGDIVRVKSV